MNAANASKINEVVNQIIDEMHARSLMKNYLHGMKSMEDLAYATMIANTTRKDMIAAFAYEKIITLPRHERDEAVRILGGINLY